MNAAYSKCLPKHPVGCADVLRIAAEDGGLSNLEWRYDFTKQPAAICPARCAVRGARITNEIAAADGGLSDMIF